MAHCAASSRNAKKSPVKAWGNIKCSVLWGCDQVTCPGLFFFLLLLLPCFASNSTFSSKVIEGYYFHSSWLRMLPFKHVEWLRAATESEWSDLAWVQAAEPLRTAISAEGEGNPVIPPINKYPFYFSGLFPLKTVIISHFSNAEPEKASPGYDVLCCRTNIFPCSPMERDCAWSPKHGPWPWCASAITLAFAYSFYRVTSLLSFWLQLRLGS